MAQPLSMANQLPVSLQPIAAYPGMDPGLLAVQQMQASIEDSLPIGGAQAMPSGSMHPQLQSQLQQPPQLLQPVHTLNLPQQRPQQPPQLLKPQSQSQSQRRASSAVPARNGSERKEWTELEDDIIRTSVLSHGCRWRRIALMLPGRSDDAVRNRWSRLRETTPGAELVEPPQSARRASSLNRAANDASGSSGSDQKNGSCEKTGGGDKVGKAERVSWSRAEDEIILIGVQQLGHRWNEIAKNLKGRTEHAIRNRYHRLKTLVSAQDQGNAPGVVHMQQMQVKQECGAEHGEPVGNMMQIAQMAQMEQMEHLQMLQTAQMPQMPQMPQAGQLHIVQPMYTSQQFNQAHPALSMQMQMHSSEWQVQHTQPGQFAQQQPHLTQQIQ